MAQLSYKQRTQLPSRSFVFKKSDKAGSGSYPIPNISHARNALARVSQNGSSEQKASVRAAVKSKFPSIKQS